jgi:CHAD domain-containing protein
LQQELSGAKILNNIECIHQSRVATRRMRAGLNFFNCCFSDKKTKKWQAQIRNLTKRLGAARDIDVQIEFINNFLNTLDTSNKQYRYGISRLLLRLQQKREKIQPKVINTIDSFISKHVLADMHGEIEKILFLNHDSKDFQSLFVFQHAQNHINKQLDELMSYESSLDRPEDKDSHHQMRISAKRLRYTLEICNPAFNNELKHFIQCVKKIQTSLGDIHDLDVWDEYLDTFVKKEMKLTMDYFGNCRSFPRLKKGLDFFHNECLVRRSDIFTEIVDYWRQVQEANLWDDLQEVVNTRILQFQKNTDVAQEVLSQ